MRRLLFLALALFPLLAGAGMSISPGVAPHTHSDLNTGGGTLSLSGSLTSTKACAAGYTRITPNFCTRDSNLGNSSLTVNTCTAVALPTANAKALLIWTSLVVSSSNAVGQRDTALSGYDNATCVSPKLTEVAIQTYEFSAVLSTTIAVHHGYFVLQTPSGNPTLQYTSSAGNSGQVLYQVRGYWE